MPTPRIQRRCVACGAAFESRGTRRYCERHALERRRELKRAVERQQREKGNPAARKRRYRAAAKAEPKPPEPERHRYPWTPADDAFLRAHPDLTHREVGAQLNRTPLGVRGRRRQLGLLQK